MNVQRTDDGKLIGYRIWLVDESIYLCPLGVTFFVSEAWKQPVAKAECLWGSLGHPTKEIPNPFCSCGLYAYKKARKACSEFARVVNEYVILGIPTSGLAVGPVYLWGKIIEHEEGYRAEYAQIGEPLCIVGTHNMEVGIISKRYGVEVFSPFSIEDSRAYFNTAKRFVAIDMIAGRIVKTGGDSSANRTTHSGVKDRSQGITSF